MTSANENSPSTQPRLPRKRSRFRPGTLTKLVERRGDLTPQDLEKSYEKECDLYSALWILLAGLVLGGGTIGIIELIKQASIVPGFLTGIGILTYNIAFWFAVTFALMGLGIVGYIVVRYNPLSVHDLFIDDFLDAREALAEKAIAIKASDPMATQTGQSPPKSASEYKSFLADTVAVFAGVFLSTELGAVPVVLGILLPALVGYMIFLILVDAAAKPRMKGKTAGRAANALVRTTRGASWLARESATFIVGAGLQLLLTAWNQGGAILFIILTAVGLVFVWQGQLLRRISSDLPRT